MKLATYLSFTTCLGILVTSSQAQTLPIFDDFEDGDAAGWIAPEYNLSGTREVVDGNFVLTGWRRWNSMDTEWGSEVYGDVSIHTLFKITAEDSAGVFARSTLDGPRASRTGFQAYAFLEGNGRLSVGQAVVHERKVHESRKTYQISIDVPKEQRLAVGCAYVENLHVRFGVVKAWL